MSTQIVKSTTTPAKVTTTIIVTSYATVTSPATKTATITSTMTSTTTATTTKITTSTTTSPTLSTSTVTIAASAGFVPVQSSLPNVKYRGTGGGNPVQERKGRRGLAGVRDQAREAARVQPRAASHSYYPQRVGCWAYTSSSTCSTVRTTSTSTVTGPTPTQTTTVTQVKTITVYPSATASITTASTIMVTAYSTSTKTETATSVSTAVSVTQIYAACATNNLADTKPEDPPYYENMVGIVEYGLTDNRQETSASSAYDCCVAGITYPGPGTVFIYYGPDCEIYYVDSSASQNTNQREAQYGVMVRRP